MSLTLHLLGRPRIRSGSGTDHTVRSRKSWAVLAFLLLGERPPTRAELAALLFAEADDPLRALRWSLAELRRGPWPGTPCSTATRSCCSWPADVVVDVDVAGPAAAGGTRSSSPASGRTCSTASRSPAPPAFESWLLSRASPARRRVGGDPARGRPRRDVARDLDRALGYAVRAAAMSPLDENHQALLIRLYRLAGDEAAAAAPVRHLRRHCWSASSAPPRGRRSRPRCASGRVDRERPPTPRRSRRWPRPALPRSPPGPPRPASPRSGPRSGWPTWRGHARLRVSTRLALAEALIHSLGGLDEEGMATLLAADGIAAAHGDAGRVARGPRRARVRRLPAGALRPGRGVALAGARDARCRAIPRSRRRPRPTWDRSRATAPTTRRRPAPARRGRRSGQAAGDPRRAAYAAVDAGPGRPAARLTSTEAARAARRRRSTCAEREHWLAFLPWPQALRGELELARGDARGAAERARPGVRARLPARRPLLGGHLRPRPGPRRRGPRRDATAPSSCWPTRGVRTNRLADPYVWLDGYILDAQCTLGLPPRPPRHRGLGRGAARCSPPGPACAS